MRRGFPIVLTCILSLLIASIVSAYAAVPDDCDCVAPDGSCSASISCLGGCTRFCGNAGNCYAECSGDLQFLGAETTLELQNTTYPELVTALAHQSGKQVVFRPMQPGLMFNVGFKRAPFWNTLELLSYQGTIEVNGQDFEKLRKLRRVLLSGDRITVCVKKTPLATFISDMVGLTGLPLRVTGGSPMAMVNIRAPDATLEEMLKQVSDQTGTKILDISTATGQQPAP